MVDSGHTMAVQCSAKRRTVASVLCIFLGVLGAHRFYVDKIGTGFLWLLTGALFGIGRTFDIGTGFLWVLVCWVFIGGWLYDMVCIFTNCFTDADGLPLLSEPKKRLIESGGVYDHTKNARTVALVFFVCYGILFVACCAVLIGWCVLSFVKPQALGDVTRLKLLEVCLVALCTGVADMILAGKAFD